MMMMVMRERTARASEFSRWEKWFSGNESRFNVLIVSQLNSTKLPAFVRRTFAIYASFHIEIGVSII